MAIVVNDRDVLIMSATPRFTAATDRGMFLTPPVAIFKLSSNGLSASPSQFVFKATLLNLPGTVSFSWTGGLSFVVSGNQATLDYANATAVSGTLTATIVVDGVTYTQIATVTKLADGLAGVDGVRGNIDISVATGAIAWSDAEAAAGVAAAGFGAPRTRDVVNLYKADRTWAQRRIFDGSSWLTLADVFDGSIFVKGSVLAEAIDSRNLTIKDENGKVLLGVNVPLAASLAAQGTLNSDLTASITAAQKAGTDAAAAAQAANNAITTITSDNVLSRVEKPQIIREFTTIDGERAGIAKSASDLGLVPDTYQATCDNLAAYLASIGPASSDWANVAVDSPVDGAYLRARFAEVYAIRQVLLNAITAKIQSNAAGADGKAISAAQAAAAAAKTATDAQQAASSANTAIATIASDNVLDKGEKPRIITEFSAIDSARAGIAASAASVGVDASTYQRTCDNLAAYLASIGPAKGDWANLAVDSPMDGAYLRDRFVDVFSARQALLNAVAAKIQSNAAVAATTASWSGVTGVLKPEDSATRGATFGVNIGGQITAANASNYVAPKAFTQTQFGGDISSDNWNGFTDSRGKGWYGQRDTGSFFMFNLYSRGALMGGSFTGFGWPSDNAPGFYLGPEGLLLGSANTGKYAFMLANGDVGMNGFSYAGGQLTLTSPIIITPQIKTSFAASIPGINTRNQVNSNSYQSFGTISAITANGVAPFRYQWSFSVEAGDMKMVGDPSAASVQIQARGTNVYSSGYLLLVITDVNGAQTSAAANIVIQFGSGVPQ